MCDDTDEIVVTPWSARAAELEPTEGHYCDYVAWKEWLDRHNERRRAEVGFELGEIDLVELYAAFCEACEGARRMTRQSESAENRV